MKNSIFFPVYEKRNVLVLDEPTNHLDLEACDALKRGLATYEGTLLVVSHNRDFLDALVDYILEIRPGEATLHHGNYSDWLAQQETAADPPVAAEPKKKKAKGPKKPRKTSAYNVYVKEKMQDATVKAAPQKEKMSLIGTMWKQLDDAGKAPYGAQADALNAANPALQALEAEKAAASAASAATTAATATDAANGVATDAATGAAAVAAPQATA